MAWFETNKTQVIYGAGIAIVLGVIVFFVIWRGNQKQQAAAEAFSRVFISQIMDRSVSDGQLAEGYAKVAAEHADSKGGMRAELFAAGNLFSQAANTAEAQVQGSKRLDARLRWQCARYPRPCSASPPASRLRPRQRKLSPPIRMSIPATRARASRPRQNMPPPGFQQPEESEGSFRASRGRHQKQHGYLHRHGSLHARQRDSRRPSRAGSEARHHAQSLYHAPNIHERAEGDQCRTSGLGPDQQACFYEQVIPALGVPLPGIRVQDFWRCSRTSARLLCRGQPLPGGRNFAWKSR